MLKKNCLPQTDVVLKAKTTQSHKSSLLFYLKGASWGILRAEKVAFNASYMSIKHKVIIAIKPLHPKDRSNIFIAEFISSIKMSFP